MTGLLAVLAALGVAAGVPAWFSSPPPTRFESSLQYVFPYQPDRRIQTFSLGASWGKSYLDRRLELYLGMTATHAWGSLTQPQGVGLPDGASQDDDASGLGPDLTARITPLRAGDLEFSLDGSAGVILYDGRFPAGGDIYNFMFRAGPRFGLALDQRTSLFLKYQWMHVSNGQGLGPWNPSYEGEGPVAGLNRSF